MERTQRFQYRSSPPPLAEGVVRATTALDRAVGVEPPWMSHA
jgi:hypothetical protein